MQTAQVGIGFPKNVGRTAPDTPQKNTPIQKRCKNNDYPRKNNGAPWSPRPTNALIPNIMQALIKLTNREFGFYETIDTFDTTICVSFGLIILCNEYAQPFR
jgi:hypothetical protein